MEYEQIEVMKKENRAEHFAAPQITATLLFSEIKVTKCLLSNIR